MLRLTLPAIGAGLLLSAAGGMALGNSVIERINPIHFQGPALHPRDRGAALDHLPVVPRKRDFASLYGWEEGRTARFEDCGDCDALEARDAHAFAFPDEDVPQVRIHRADERGHYGLDEPAFPDVEEMIATEAGSEEGVQDRVLRYAYYEIESGVSSEGSPVEPALEE